MDTLVGDYTAPFMWELYYAILVIPIKQTSISWKVRDPGEKNHLLTTDPNFLGHPSIDMLLWFFNTKHNMQSADLAISWTTLKP